MKKYILAIDQGTTSSRAFLVDHELNICGSAQKEFKQIYPKPGLVEHGPEDIWNSVVQVIKSALNKNGISPKEIAGIGITNQRETTLIWDKKTGKALGNAIVWQDRRTADICEKLKKSGREPMFRKKTGLVLDPYFSGTKIAWLLKKISAAGKLCGTVDTFLAWRLTGGVAHVTDVSNASRTLLMNLKTCEWDDELLKIFGIPRAILPTIVDSSAIAGFTKGLGFLPDGIPIASMIGDQQAALYGQICTKSGEMKCTYGTGSFLLMNTGEKIILPKEKIITTVAWRKNGRTTYALEGSTFIAGAAVQWLRDGLGIIKHSHEIEALAKKVSSSEGVTFVPAFVGLGAPHWRANAKGLIGGITRGTTAAHIARATLDGIALQQCDLMSTISKAAGKKIKEVRVDGGASKNDLLMQIQSNLLGATIVRPRQIETTVMGAAFLAGLATGFWSSENEIKKHWQEEKRFTPKIGLSERKMRLEKWHKEIAKA